tara:strand:- start:313 stop:597 length:285 start_codon:yes stop_codon:yes gene_type:complete
MEGLDMGESELTALTQGIFELKVAVENMAAKQQEMVDDVKKIKEAVYNPDSGIYARLRELEQWKTQQQKYQWAVMVTLIGLVTATVYKTIFPII